MIDDISMMQDRIAEIQSRIDALTPGNGQPNDTAGVGAASNGPGSFAQVLDQRIRPNGPGASVGKVYVPPAPPLPDNGVIPFVPQSGQIVPVGPGKLGKYEPYIQKYSAANGLSPDLVRAVIQTESDGDPNCLSDAGAMGLMQLMPDNVRDAGISDAYDPEQNIKAGAEQLADLLTKYNGNLDLALAGYNAGPGNVAKYGGIPPFPETQNYIRKVKAAMDGR